MSIENQLRKLREAKGYSQEYMALQLEMSQNGYCKIENGRVDIKLKTLQRIADILQIKLFHLFDGACETCSALGSVGKGEPKPEIKDRERELYEQLLLSKDGQITAQQQLIRKYEEEIDAYKAYIEQSAPNAGIKPGQPSAADLEFPVLPSATAVSA
jgi:transcriptional regulator with XRE-family HTH domain